MGWQLLIGLGFILLGMFAVASWLQCKIEKTLEGMISGIRKDGADE